MKVRNKKTGEIGRLDFGKNKETGELIIWVMTAEPNYYKSLKELLDAGWEDNEPKEPLIKDEKIRKAVRAWADMNDIRYIEPCARLHKENYRIVGFNALHRSFTMEISNEYDCRISMGQALSRKMRNAYTIDELCGEQ